MGGVELVAAYALAWSAAAAALIRGRADPERRRISLAALVWMTAAALRGDISSAGPVGLLLLDGLLFFILIALSWKARRNWPIFAALVQGFGLAVVLAHATDPRVDEALQMTVSGAAAHLATAILVVGGWWRTGGGAPALPASERAVH